MTRLKWATASVSCAALALFVWFGLRLGPVLMEISDKHDQGLHLGDILVGAPLAVAAIVSAAASLSTRPRRR